MILEYKREYGLFSNVNILQRVISEHILMGHTIEDIQLLLPEYFDYDKNLYRELFKMDPKMQLNPADMQYLLYKCQCDVIGFFNEKTILERANVVKNRFLSFSDKVVAAKYGLIKEYGIPQDYFFAWYRGTDKSNEVSLPSFEQFVAHIRTLNTHGLPVIIKTDSLPFTEYLYTKSNLKFNNIELIDLRSENKPLCGGYIATLNDGQFKEMYGIDKVLYLQQLLAVTDIAANAKIFLSTPSNIATYVIQNRGNFDNVYVYRDANSFLY